MSLYGKIRSLFTKGPASSSRRLKICELNAENLFISLEYYENNDFENISESQWRQLALPQLRHKQKPLSKVWGLHNAILDINPDILMLIEVGGKESLDHFNRYFLKEAYKVHYIETNSKRGIDLAFLLKKDLVYTAKTVSNRETPVKIPLLQGTRWTTRFSRDVVELHLFENSELKLILLLTHLKSKISTETDFQGRDLRRAEAEALANLYENIRKKHPEVGVVVGGDFNSDLKSPELELILNTDLSDFHDLLESSEESRISLVHFDYQGKAHPQTLDYLLVSPHLKNKVIKEESYTYRYKSFYDLPHPLPTTVHERYHMPSDHFPLVVTLEI
ncbi:MAG: endonuclease/exonuclease/phosphatase family protein [Bdellovibrionales bacterium]|nr:endonuclease/exonuclease/phosphatase family protein [Bdellovibrionales bacterium]